MTDEASRRPIYWRVCNILREIEVSGVKLDVGWWTMAFPFEPQSSTRKYAPGTEVDDPTGAVLFVRVHTAPDIADDFPIPYRQAAAFAIERYMRSWGWEQRKLDEPRTETS